LRLLASAFAGHWKLAAVYSSRYSRSFPHPRAYHKTMARAEQMFEHLSEHLFEQNLRYFGISVAASYPAFAAHPVTPSQPFV
jgi:hypothetical protein